MQKFGTKVITIQDAAAIFHKDATWIRAGIIAGWLPIGIATRDGEQVKDVRDISSKKGRINYYISPKLIYELTGFIWRDNDEN